MNLDSIHEAFLKAIEEKIFSAAQVCVGIGQECLFHHSYGTHFFGEDPLVTAKASIFDVASLTKPVVTTTLLMQAFEASKFKLEDSIQKFLSGWTRSEPITLKHLLAHNSGLPDWLPLYKKAQEKNPEQAKEIYLQAINAVPLAMPVGSKRIYSDLGFMLLGWVIEEIEGKSLDELFSERVAKPLGMEDSFFASLLRKGLRGGSREKARFVATEHCPWRKKLLVGEVHDENTYTLGEVAGHAGLFSTARDLKKFVHALWQAWQGNATWVSQKTLQLFLQAAPKLGWDSLTPPYSQAGQYFSSASFGHLAFTGCSLWLDPEDQKYIILLTNRVHSSRHIKPEPIKRFRPKIHDLLVERLIASK